jgi:uridine kinase
VAVAGVIGSGKSALMRALAQALGEPVALSFDDYEMATAQSPDKLAAWLSDGADFNQLSAPGLVDDLATLQAGGSVAHRRTGQVVQCQKYVLFEMPLGRAWQATAAATEVLVWIDTPADVALARRIREISLGLATRESSQGRRGLLWLSDYLRHYCNTVREVLLTQERVVRGQADLVVNGLDEVATNVQRVLRHLGHTP